LSDSVPNLLKSTWNLIKISRNLSEKYLKSVHITNYYHKTSGGVSTSYNKLLEAAERHGRFVRLIVPAETDSVEEVNEFAKIYYVAAPSSPFFDKRYRLMMPWQYLLKDSPIRKILLAEMPDMIEVYDNYSLTFIAGMIRIGKFKRLGRPLLVYFTGERFDTIVASFVSKGRFGNWFSRRLTGNYNLAMFDFYIANSLFVAEELYQSLQKKHNPHRFESFFNFCQRFFRAAKVPLSQRLAICPRGVDANFFNPNRTSIDIKREMRERANIPPDSIVLLSSTRLSPEKNVRFLPEIMEVLARNTDCDFRLLVAGEGPQADWLQAETDKRFPNKIIRIGHLDKETLADYYANSDAFIHPNPREPFGNVVQEALASGVPVIVPNSGGVLASANNENAWLCDLSGESFADAIIETIENKQLRAQKTNNAIRFAQTHTHTAATDLLFETYDRMFADFQNRRELFDYKEKATDVNFTEIIDK
jgi:glycosyltransferase involved in cell wall biosynthesis